MDGELTDYIKGRYKPQNINQAHKERLNFQDKIALSITGGVGTMYAVYTFILFLLAWMLWQTFIDDQPFDPYPFAFLLFIGNVIQLLLMPLIMVGQNIQGKHAEIRAEEEFKTTESSYSDVEQVLLHLDQQDKKMQQQLDVLMELSKKLKHH